LSGYAEPGLVKAYKRERETYDYLRHEKTMELKIPKALRIEHEGLHSELVEATNASGKTGAAAKAVAEVLHAHFVEEEEYALPPLGLLSLLAEGKATPDMENVLTMTDRLKAEHHQMLGERKAIGTALKNLSD